MDKYLPWGAEFDTSAPWNQRDSFECACCKEIIENDEPIMIDHDKFCDICASDLQQLRFNGYIGEISEKTHKLVKRVDDANYQKIHEQEFDKLPKLKHL